jgi:hypothetical protein
LVGVVVIRVENILRVEVKIFRRLEEARENILGVAGKIIRNKNFEFHLG